MERKTVGRTRSFMKTLSWRAIATSITFAVSYTLTGEIVVAAGIGGLDAGRKIVAYYGHERIWERFRG